MPVPQHHTGQGLHLDIAQAVALNLRKIADLGLRKADVFNFARREPSNRSFDVCLRQSEAGRVPAVKLAAVVAHGGVAALLNVFEDALHRGAHLRIVVGPALGVFAAFEISNHGNSTWFDLAQRFFCIRMQCKTKKGFGYW